MIRRSLLAAVLLACYALAAPVLTTIQDVIYKADGTPFNGTLTINWKSFQSADNSAIMMQTITANVINGNLFVQLVPNAAGAPPIYYSVTYNAAGRVQFQEIWSVPFSITPLRVSDVRVSASSGAGSASSTGAVPEAEVAGLIGDLAARPIKGSAFVASRTAVVDSAGLVESATGNATDCVHVDGSSGSCGTGAALPSQIGAGGASAGQALVYTGAAWQPRGITLNRYSFPVAGTSVYLAAIYHGLGSNVALLGCQDASGATFQPGGINVDSAGDITVTAATSMSGLCVLSGSPSGAGQYVASFTAAASITLSASTLGLGLTPTVPACYDALGNWFEPGSVIADSSGDLTIAFAVAQTGKCILQ